ncbi:MAG: hypothetical protein JWO03_651 [Bacteroidetes bacterium]|nr:hypothetical protein [Bacteroidota bacterium]
MLTQKEMTEAISRLTLEIQEKYPEMSKYIAEMPVTNPDEEHPDITAKKLTDYYNDLLAIMKRYATDHELATDDLKAKVEDEKL